MLKDSVATNGKICKTKRDNSVGLYEVLKCFLRICSIENHFCILGTIVHYLKSPKGGSLKLRPSGDEADVQTFVQDLILIGEAILQFYF